MSNEKIQDGVLSAIDYLIAQRISELPLDKTITCTIEEKDETGYWVTDGTVRFHVNSDNKDYQPKWQVIVLIPGGDYSSEEKTILSRKGLSKEAEKIIPYVKPSEQIIPAWTKKDMKLDKEYDLGTSYKNCNSISISSKVKTTFDETVSEGIYSLVVDISDGSKTIRTTLNNKVDMFGDTYHFYVPLPQEAAYKIDLSALDMSKAKVKCYKYRDTELVDENIEFSDISIALGYDVVTEELNSIKIVEEGANLRALWYNKTEENKYIENSDATYTWEISPDQKIWQPLEDTNSKVSNPMIVTWQHTYVRVSVELKPENEEDEPTIYISEVYDIENSIDLGATQLGDTVIFSGMEITHGTDSRDSYNCYGYTNMVIGAEDNIKRTLSRKAILKDIYKVDETPTFSENSKTYWYVPEVSMIKTTFSAITDADAKDKTIDGYNIYSANEKGDFTYTISSWFMPYASVSEIICRVYPNDNETKEYFEAKKQISFTTKGSQGTDYSLILSKKDGSYTAELFDPQGKKIEDATPSIVEPTKLPGIASATVEVPGTDLTLKTYLPVAVEVSDYVYAGPREIIYDSFGGNPKYDESLFHFVGETGSNGWSYNGKNVSSINDIISDLQFYDAKKQMIVVKHKDEWEQPIFLYQDIYGSSYLNEWDGQLKIDNDTNKILASMVGAGYKDSNNAFHGVLMGKVQEGSQQQTGIFGYHEGAQSFGFRNDGTAFIGKSDEGRIYLDGNDSTITGGKESMVIDLKNSKITSPGFELSGAGVENAKMLIGELKTSTAGKDDAENEGNKELGTGILYEKDNFELRAKNFALNSTNVLFDNQNLLIKSESPVDINNPYILELTDKTYVLKSKEFAYSESSQTTTLFEYIAGKTNNYFVRPYPDASTSIPENSSQIKAFIVEKKDDNQYYIKSYYGNQDILIGDIEHPNNNFPPEKGVWVKIALINPQNMTYEMGTIMARKVGGHVTLGNDGVQSYQVTSQKNSGSGMQIDLMNKIIKIFNDSNFIQIGGDEQYALQIGAIGNPALKIKWDGSTDTSTIEE